MDTSRIRVRLVPETGGTVALSRINCAMMPAPSNGKEVKEGSVASGASWV